MNQKKLCACCDESAVMRVKVNLCGKCFDSIKKRSTKRKDYDPALVEQENGFFG
jgi:hypothetical protein